MGYSYGRTAAGRMALACDNCGKVGGVRKRTCPHRVLWNNARSAQRQPIRYCYPPAYCQDCWKACKDTVHADCAAGAAKSQAEQDTIQARLDAGERIVISAVGDWADDVPAGLVRVKFGGAGGSDGPAGWVDYLVPDEDYRNGGWLSDYPNAVPLDQKKPAVPERCDHQTTDPGCERPDCWGVPSAQLRLTVGRRVILNRTTEEPGIFSIGRDLVAGLGRALRPVKVTSATWGETTWERDRTVRRAHGFELRVGDHDVRIIVYLSRSPMQADMESYVAVFVDAVMVAAGIPTTRGPELLVADVVRPVKAHVQAAAEKAASYSHMYERPSGPIVRTVYAHGDRVMVRFEGEAPYTLSLMWTADEAQRRVHEMRRTQVDSDHDWALQIDRTMRMPATPVTQPRIADIVRIQYAYESARDGSRVDITDEAGARRVADQFGHAIEVRPAGDDMSLLVATPATRGDGGSARLHAMACNAGLLAVIVGIAEWEAAGTTGDAEPATGYPRRTSDGRGLVWACCESVTGPPCQHRGHPQAPAPIPVHGRWSALMNT